MKIHPVTADLFHANGRTDGRTDRQTDRHDEGLFAISRRQLKTEFFKMSVPSVPTIKIRVAFLLGFLSSVELIQKLSVAFGFQSRVQLCGLRRQHWQFAGRQTACLREKSEVLKHLKMFLFYLD
jgi:hypothetical protein